MAQSVRWSATFHINTLALICRSILCQSLSQSIAARALDQFWWWRRRRLIGLSSSWPSLRLLIRFIILLGWCHSNMIPIHSTRPFTLPDDHPNIRQSALWSSRAHEPLAARRLYPLARGGIARLDKWWWRWTFLHHHHLLAYCSRSFLLVSLFGRPRALARPLDRHLYVGLPRKHFYGVCMHFACAHPCTCLHKLGIDLAEQY